MDKLLIMVRHGQRDTSQRELDNGLNDKGRDQARLLRRFFELRFDSDDLKSGLWVVSSPKRRCVETLTPIAKGIDREVDIHPDLDELGAKETMAAGQARIQRFLTEWRQSNAAITVLCSHGDWLPLATQQLMGVDLSFKKGSWLELEWADDRANLRWMIPSFKAIFS